MVYAKGHKSASNLVIMNKYAYIIVYVNCEHSYQLTLKCIEIKPKNYLLEGMLYQQLEFNGVTRSIP